MASSGHRGRDDARGQRCCGSPGLTRIANRAASDTCRDGRSAPPRHCARSRGIHPLRQRIRPCGSCDCAQDDTVGEGTLVGHEKERRRRDARFASSPMARANAGRGHRRGLDGPTMAKPFKKNADSSPANVVCRHAMRGTARRGSLFCEVKEEEAAGRRGTRTKQAPPVSRA